MICQKCQAKTATVHFMKVINGEKTESHYCETCAKQQGEPFPGYIPSHFSVHDLLSGMIGQVNQPVDIRCGTCGLSYGQFSKQGRFGCSDCYKHFEPRLDPIFRRVHGHTAHIGKVPKRTGQHLRIKREIEELKKELQHHIDQQQFEQAAMIRDRIKELGDG